MKQTLKISIVIFSAFVLYACKKDKPALPVLTTTTVTEISYTTATSGGFVINEGGAGVVSMGICWNTAQKPTIENNMYTTDGSTGAFTVNLTGLTPNTLYYVRAFATNEGGTGYGEQVSFTTINTGIPELETTNILEISGTSAVSGGNITDDNGSEVTTRGICWATIDNPTVNDSKIIDASGGKGFFSGNLAGLDEGTLYHVRAYATNSIGTAYGNQLSFVTNVSDIDGNIYRTVIIGTQAWLTKNLKVTHYGNGDEIPYTGGSIYWLGNNTGLYCNYNDDPDNGDVYGRLYNWYSVNDNRKLCPAGWHVPADSEWETLGTFLGGPASSDGILTLAGGKMKEAGLTHWTGMNVGADNSSGFTALPGGRRSDDGMPPFGNLNTDAFWWSSTEIDALTAFSRCIYGTSEYLIRENYNRKSQGFSVRCIKD